MNKKLAVMLTVAAFGLAHVTPVIAQTNRSAPAQTSPKKSAAPKKKAAPKKSIAPKKKTTKTTKPKRASWVQPTAVG
jgi:hypothetical protein